MAYASRAGRARISPTNPQALSVCDRCGIWYNRVDLINQVAWRGSALMPTYMFVCSQCWDRPNDQERAIILPADPVPISQPRTEPYLYDETNSLGLATEDGFAITGQPIGAPVGLEPYAVSPMGINPTTGQYQAYGVDVDPLSVLAGGDTTVTVTCRSAHGLATNDQVSAAGLSDVRACGFFSVTVGGATTFSYSTVDVIPAGSLLTNTTRIVTVLVGLPRGYTTIPQVSDV